MPELKEAARLSWDSVRLMASGSSTSVSSKEIASVSKANPLTFKATYETKTEAARFADGSALEKGKTYTYNGTSWNAA